MVKQTQIIRLLLPTNYLNVVGYFVGLALKRLNELWLWRKFVKMVNYFCRMIEGREPLNFISIRDFFSETHHQKSLTHHEQDSNLYRI